MTAKGIVAKVAADSIAAELGIAPGDRLIAVNGKPVTDIIDLSFALADEYVELVVEKVCGDEEELEIEKEYDDDLGLEFESAVFDKVRQCANKCVFCFVDQMPPGMRDSLYIKDDDYRLSFLYGNFITLTNLTSRDMERIRKLHLSPLYVSVHATSGDVRATMLGHRRAKDIMEQLKKLVAYGVEIHTQVVLCPGINDGDVLERTISELYALQPNVLSLAIVPVGLTGYREDCYPLAGFTPEKAGAVIRSVQSWQERCKKETGQNFVYLADEFYLAADHPIPDYDEYDGFPQLENGVGLVRSFLSEWDETDVSSVGYGEPQHLDVVCGVSAAKILQPLLATLSIHNLHIRLIPVENNFFGSGVTVTGLLTGLDILDTLGSLAGKRNGIVLPGVALRKGEDVLLDGITVGDISAKLGVPIHAAYSAAGLKQLLARWR